MLHLSLDAPPHAVFSVQTHGSALNNIYVTISVATAGNEGASKYIAANLSNSLFLYNMCRLPFDV